MENTMQGKVVLVTGATSGIGEATAERLAGMGAEVIITYRNKEKADQTLASIRQKHPNANVSGMYVDLEDLASVRKLAAEFRDKYGRLDVLINNAGAMFTNRGTTKDGFERTIGLNHLSHFTLTLELLDLIKQSSPSRIINVSSAAQSQGKMNFDDLMAENSFSGFRAYCQSKLANVIFTYDLARKLQGTNVVVHALHPGVVATGFGLNEDGFFSKLVKLGQGLMIRPEKGAETSVFLASNPEVTNQTGLYWSKCKVKRTRRESYDPMVQKRLWDISEQLTGASWPTS